MHEPHSRRQNNLAKTINHEIKSWQGNISRSVWTSWWNNIKLRILRKITLPFRVGDIVSQKAALITPVWRDES